MKSTTTTPPSSEQWQLRILRSDCIAYLLWSDPMNMINICLLLKMDGADYARFIEDSEKILFRCVRKMLVEKENESLRKENCQKETGEKPNLQLLLAQIQECGRTRNLKQGKQVHAQAVACRHSFSIYEENALISMYAKCGSIVDARQVFDGLKEPTVVSWNALILGCANNGQGHTALELFAFMITNGSAPNAVTFVASLKACTCVAVNGVSGWVNCWNRGKAIHSVAVENGCNSDIYVQSTLVDMYGKLGSMEDAHQVFDCMKHRNVVSWNALMLGYADNGRGHSALELFVNMRSEGIFSDSVTYVGALKACTSLILKGDSEEGECRPRGKAIHSLAAEIDCNSEIYESTLVDMYGKCGSLVNARQEFENMKHRTVVSWNVMIFGYADNGQGRTALELFTRMKTEGQVPNSVTFVATLKACTSLAVKEGTSVWAECGDRNKALHTLVSDNDCSLDSYVQSTLMDMYANCGKMADACQVFESMKQRTVVSWNVLILGYADNGQGRNALKFFTRMRDEGTAPDSITFVGALKAATSLAVKKGSVGWMESRDRGKALHNLVTGDSDIYVQSTLVDMYAKFGCMMDAHQVFDSIKYLDVVTWNALIMGYAENGQGVTALELFRRMRSESPRPNSVTYLASLKACGLVGALDFGRTIHSEIKNDLDVVLVTCLVNFYAKCGSLVEAQNVFDLHSETRNMITWTALLTGFSSCGDVEGVFRVFKEMQDTGFRPDGVTCLCILACCSHSGLVEKGKACFDAMPTKYDIVPNIEHYNCMIDIFGRANKLDDAMALLECMPCSPDDVTWMTVLSACRIWKNVEIGRLAFESLITINDRDPSGYVLMGQIYQSKGMLQEQEMVLGMRKKIGVWKKPEEETCWTNEVGEVHTFSGEQNQQHPQIHEIRAKWEAMALMMRIEEEETFNEEELCGHSEKLALACALINTKPGKSIRIVKNFKVCNHCHSVIASMSNLDHRSIICIDAHRIHVFTDGKCSCA